ncbi:hypothetical protein GGX14DRAFT_574692 [Mycena pura]|uniref:Uncharacterized protein n=1 Tax=Mycena pura TaxID=153505 RepID=A0AAD6Y2X8_9AGAR|nr:hypothetical protein GGX14DRAFT_574692 [Mycena pura]
MASLMRRCAPSFRGTAPPSVPTGLGEEFTGHSPRLSGGNFSQPPTDIVRVERAPTLMARLPTEFINRFLGPREARSARPRHSHPVARNLRNARTQLAEHARVAHAPSHPHASGKSAPRATAHSLAHSARSIARRTPPVVCRAPPACIAQDSRPPIFPAARRRTPDRESFSLPALPSVLIIFPARPALDSISSKSAFPTGLGEEFTGHSPRLSGGNFSQPPTDIVRVERAPTLMARLPTEFINFSLRPIAASAPGVAGPSQPVPIDPALVPLPATRNLDIADTSQSRLHNKRTRTH